VTDQRNAAPAAATAMSAIDRARRIAAMNDAFRKSLKGGRLVVTHGVDALGTIHVLSLLFRVRTFDAFSPDNDPHGEHDFGAFDDGDLRLFWKIDYYNATLDGGSSDPCNAEITTRVLTLMLASEY